MSAGVRLRGGSTDTFESPPWERTLRLSLADAALSTTLQTLTTGVFLTGFGLAIGASQIQIGILAALPTLGNIAQIAGSYLIERTGQRKSLCLWATSAARVIWLGILTAPLIVVGRSTGALASWVMLLMGVSSGLAAIGGVAWLSWIKDLVPNGRRADFLSRRNQIGTGLALTLSVVAGLFLDWWESHWESAVGGFGVVFALATGCGLAAIPFLRATPDAPMPRLARPEPFSKLITLPIRDTNFRRLVVFYAFWNLGVNLASPFFNVYMLRELDLPFWYVTALNTLAGVCSLAANRFWVRLSSQFGNKPVVFLATLANAFFPLPWIFIDRQFAWVLLFVHLSGFFNSVLVLGPNNIMFKLAPDRNGSAYLAIFNAVIGPATALAPILGGLLASATGEMHTSIGPLSLSGIKLVFLTSFVLRLSSLLLLHRVSEPEAKAVQHVVRVLRSNAIPGLVQELPAVLAMRRDPPMRAAPAARSGETNSAASNGVRESANAA
jgi:MFS family permease